MRSRSLNFTLVKKIGANHVEVVDRSGKLLLLTAQQQAKEQALLARGLACVAKDRLNRLALSLNAHGQLDFLFTSILRPGFSCEELFAKNQASLVKLATEISPLGEIILEQSWPRHLALYCFTLPLAELKRLLKTNVLIVKGTDLIHQAFLAAQTLAYTHGHPRLHSPKNVSSPCVSKEKRQRLADLFERYAHPALQFPEPEFPLLQASFLEPDELVLAQRLSELSKEQENILLQDVTATKGTKSSERILPIKGQPSIHDLPVQKRPQPPKKPRIGRLGALVHSLDLDWQAPGPAYALWPQGSPKLSVPTLAPLAPRLALTILTGLLPLHIPASCPASHIFEYSVASQ